jgi:hypothetical protein
MAPAFSATVKALSSSPQAPCAAFTIAPSESAAVARSMTGPTRPDGWVVDSPDWLALANARAGLGLKASEPFARSGVVVAMAPDKAESLTRRDWPSLLTAASPLRFPDPTRTTAGRLAAAAAASAPQFATALAASVRKPGVAPDLAAVASGSAGFAVPASEAEVLAWNSAHTDSPVAAVAPDGAVPAFEYRFVAVSDNTVSENALSALQEFLVSKPGGEVLAEHGFRVAGATAKSPSPLYGQVTLGSPVKGASGQVDRRWVAAAPRRQATLVLDVSGSLLERIDRVTRLSAVQSGVQAALGQLPDTSAVSLWYFSQHIGPRNDDAKNVVPWGNLSDSAQAKAVAQALESLREYVGGGAGLYDAIATAYADARARYAADRSNVVVVVVEGPNKDDYGLSLPELTSALAQDRDAARPLPLVIVGIGPKVDAKQMKQIAAPTGGTFLPVTSADDVLPALRTALGGD